MPRARLTAREQERAAARRPARRRRALREAAPPLTSSGEALAMLRRRGFDAKPGRSDLPFPMDFPDEGTERLSRHLGHYAFRLFLRGAMQHPEGFRPAEVTRYVGANEARRMAEELCALGLAEGTGRGRYRLLHPTRSFGGTLEWYVARELRERLGFDTAAGVRFGAPGIGGDLDVVAAAEGRMVLLELKSSPPRQLDEAEVAAFFDRLSALRPDLALFVVDTALRLGDKVVPMLLADLERRSGRTLRPRRLGRELWALGPRLYAVGAKGDLVANLARALAAGLRSLAPDPLAG
jgi:hypothetical protein